MRALWLVTSVVFGSIACNETGAEVLVDQSAADVYSSEVSSSTVEVEGASDVHELVHPEASFGVVLGTGRNRLMPLSDGDVLYLELGHQGLQHVLVSIRLSGLPQDRYVVDFQLIRDDGIAVSEPARVRLPFVALSDGSGVELLGYTLVVVEPALGIGRDAVLRVSVEGPNGEFGRDERRVRVEWAPHGWNPDT